MSTINLQPLLEPQVLIINKPKIQNVNISRYFVSFCCVITAGVIGGLLLLMHDKKISDLSFWILLICYIAIAGPFIILSFVCWCRSARY